MPEYRCDKCGNTFHRVIADHCKVCGATDSLKPTSSSDSTTAESAMASPWQTVRDMRAVYNGLKLLFTGVFIVALGMLLIFMSDLRDDPRRIGTGDIVRGGVTALVGVILFALAILYFRKSAKGSR